MTDPTVPAPPPAPPCRARTAVVVAVAGAVLLVGAGIVLPMVLDDDAAPAATGSTGQDEPELPAGLEDVVTFTTLRSDHVTESVDDYESSPPAGGRHFPVWLECGVYDETVRDEFLVHDLEHGAFWFAYDPDRLDDAQVEALAEQLPDNGVMTPYDGLETPVVVTVWEAQLALDGVDDLRLPLFLDAYAGGTTAPEPFASCAGGATPDEIADLALPTDLAFS